MTYLLQVSTCWIVFYIIYMLFLQKETFFSINRCYLLTVLLAGLLIPFLGELLPANSTSTEVYQVMTQVTSVEITHLKTEQSTSVFTWLNLLYLIYFVGVLVVTSRFIYGLYKIYTIYRSAHKTKYANYTLVESSKYHLPFSFFQFIFISKELPINKDVEKILKHEELHAYQWHSLDIVMTEILQIFFWFNPILIFYKNALRQSHEFLADAYVTKDHNRSSYGQLLLRQSTSGLEIALANHFFHSQIKKRITMLYKEKSKRPAMVKYLAAIPVLAAMLFIFSSSKMDNQSKIESDDECTSMRVEDNYKYSLEGQQISLSQFEAKINNDNPPKCINLYIKSSTYVKSITPILEAASKAEIEVRLFKDDMIENEMMSEKDFGGRKIISRANVFHLLPNKNLYGNITINAEADKSGNIIYAEISNEETTIKDKDILLKVLRIVKTNKIEKGDGNVKGQFIYTYEKKEQIDYTYSTKDNTFKIEGTESQGDPTYKVVEEMPRFPGCEEIVGTIKEKEECAKQKMLEYIYNNITYPSSARNAKIEGMVVLQFNIEKNGKISSGKIVREIGEGCGHESLRVVNSMPTWIPGKQKGKAVRVQYTLPVKFKLEKNDVSDEQKNFMINGTGFGKKSDNAKKKGQALISSQGDDIFKVVEEMPRFIGCEDIEGSTREKEECAKGKMLEFIYANLKYPKEAKEKGIEGVAVVKLIIEKDGSISSSDILRDPGGGTAAEAKRVMDLMPKWIPGKQRGKKVRVQYVLPIKYKLEGDEQSTNSKQNKILNGSLSMTVDKFKSLETIETLMAATGLSPECKIKEYRLVHVKPKQDATVSTCKTGPFSDFTKSQIQSANVDDRYFVEEFQCQCPGDEKVNNKGGFYIKITSNDEKTVEEVDIKPLFPDAVTDEESTNKLLDFVFNNIKYPKEAIQNEIEGLAIVKFIITSEGDIQKVRIVRSPGWGLDEVVMDMMDEMKLLSTPWTPAILNDKNVNFEYTLPVKFKLQDNQIKEAESRKLDIKALNISPNPSNGMFTLAFNIDDRTPADIVFYSTSGQVLRTLKKVNIPYSKSIDLSEFNGQTIFMNIIQKDKVYSDKIVVQ